MQLKNIFMDKIIKLGFLLFLNISCKAQNPIIKIEDQDGEPVKNTYYKDVNNLLDPFTGTYLYTDSNTSLKIILQKKILSYDGFCYEDLIIGEYQYIENGIEKTNTLSKINTNYTNQNEHSIHGNYVFTNSSYLCQDCQQNEKRLLGGMVEQSTGNVAQIIIQKLTVNNQPAIKINIWWRTRGYQEGTPPLLRPSFPGGDYILIKQ